MSGEASPVVSATGLTKTYRTRSGRSGVRLTALEGFDMAIGAGETVALVGESGSGKTTAARLILRLIDADAGSLVFEGADITRASEAELRRNFRRKVAAVFQNPGTSLSPHLRVEEMLLEPLRIHRVGTPAERRERVHRMLERVGLPARLAGMYGQELSGGQRQRVGIARALMLDPTFVVADEPTSALDVSVQAQIINLLADLQHEQQLAYLFITHDLALASHVATSVVVMFLGSVCEVGPPTILTGAPQHPYTAILASMGADTWQRILPLGDPPSPISRPEGCLFSRRCPAAQEICRQQRPQLTARPDGRGSVACHFPGALQLTAVPTAETHVAPPRLTEVGA